MDVSGAFDQIAMQPDGRVIAAGWAMAENADGRIPVSTILLQGLDRAELRFFSRPDFDGEDNRFGFSLGLESRFDLFKLHNGESAAFAIHKGVRFRLPFWSELDAQVAALEGEAQADTAGRAVAEQGTLAQMLDRLRPVYPQPVSETVTHEIGVGFTSYDRAVIVGREGHLFLLGGSNAVENLYALGDPALLSAAWLQLIRGRAERFAAMGQRFVQLIIPEKQSVLARAFPGELSTPTPVLRAILAGLRDEPWFIDGLACLSDVLDKQGLDPFRKIDTHLAFPGARALATALAQRGFGITPPVEHPPLRTTRLSGDLGNKIGLGTLMETVLWPDVADWPFAQVKVETARAIDPPDGGHTGCIREYRCATPLIDKSVLIFGNSFFGRDDDPFALSWWASRLFRRTVFHWSAAVDYAVVEAEKPDLVICQTIERFLPGVPAA